LTDKVPLREFHEIDGSDPNPEKLCIGYVEELSAANPLLGLLGIGEDWHLAFNDLGVANFDKPFKVKVVLLDPISRQQEVAEGWFETYQDTPELAISVTIPTLYRVPKLIVSVRGDRKATIMWRTVEEAISTDCPSTFLRMHSDATVYLDSNAATGLMDVLSQ
jgi:glucosamine-6-phosphate deaminase